MKKIIIACIIGWVLVFFSGGAAFCGSGSCSVEKGTCVAGSTTDSAKEAVQDAAADSAVKPAINTLCPVMGGKIDPNTPFFVEYQGKKIGLCCADCIKAFNAEPEKYMKKVEEELQAAKTAGTEKKEETAVKPE